MSVYFAAAGGYIKVGYSADPIKRTQWTTIDSAIRPIDLERGTPVELLGWIPGGRDVERQTHARLGERWIAGEWFTDCDAVREVLHSAPEAAVVAEISAMALLAVLRGAPVAAAASAWPLNRRLAEDVISDFLRGVAA